MPLAAPVTTRTLFESAFMAGSHRIFRPMDARG
jgi:hypothetical protein